jgi:hypothetical protein
MSVYQHGLRMMRAWRCLGECYAGAARGFTDVVMMTLDTGIGGVAMIEGKLLRGKHAQAVAWAGTFRQYSMVDHAFAGQSGARKRKRVAGHFP